MIGEGRRKADLRVSIRDTFAILFLRSATDDMLLFDGATDMLGSRYSSTLGVRSVLLRLY